VVRVTVLLDCALDVDIKEGPASFCVSSPVVCDSAREKSEAFSQRKSEGMGETGESLFLSQRLPLALDSRVL
jgi:hypothetical protein